MGYKIRTHIAKSLQTQSKTICTAITNYNKLAILLGKPTLDWTKDINQQLWANPAICKTMCWYQRLQHVKEEITRCNIEIQCLHTSIIDEHQKFDEIMKKMLESPDSLNLEDSLVTPNQACQRLLFRPLLLTPPQLFKISQLMAMTILWIQIQKMNQLMHYLRMLEA
ncbi:hypothetical protein C0992_008486 [Termitomyces sp. T32_za158]|nr:hypothetical protein C0992_008486 [Termitomyces sp. T32_za158]